MSCLKFDKAQLVNLEYSLSRELLRSNRAGTFASSTILWCNTRKYHGLLICPMENLDGENHVLLSAFDETVIQQGASFNLGIRRYQGGKYEPRGHKYIREFETDPMPGVIYRVGGVLLRKESILSEEAEQVLFRYTLLEANSPTTLQFRPFLAYRNMHQLSKANLDVETGFYTIKNGVKVRMYNGYPYLHMQFSKDVEYVHVPDWYYNVEYTEEQKRGYDYHEDLFVPGYFELPIKKGESIVVSVSTKEINPAGLKKHFDSNVNHRIARSSYENCLQNAAEQFIVRNGKKTEIIAGFPWFGRWGRDTFISLPGLTLSLDDPKTCKAVIDTMSAELNGPLFPNMGGGLNTVYNSVDAPMWYFWAVQQYAEYTKSTDTIWKLYGSKFKKILEGFREGTVFNIKMHDNGLVYAGEAGHALTWMDAVVHGKPITPRIGYNVEINALWFNAINFALECAKLADDKAFIKKWKDVPALTQKSFIETFWDAKKGYLADYVNGDFKDWSVRPNQVFATSLPYVMIEEDIRKSILDVVQSELLTPKGLRTLAPKNPAYIGIYEGDQPTRDAAYHQGTVWPWLLGHFVEGYLKIHERSGVAFATKIYEGFKDDMKTYGVSSIGEIYDGDPPHEPKGAISQAWSVAEVLRIKTLIDKYSDKK